MPRCNYRGPRARYIPSDCKWCNPENCQEYQDYVKIQDHQNRPLDRPLGEFAHKWYRKHHVKKCPACGIDLTVQGGS